MNGLVSFERGKVVSRFKLRNAAATGESFHEAFSVAVRRGKIVRRKVMPPGQERLLRMLPVLRELGRLC